MTTIICSDHKTYKAKLPPRPTKRNPHGCAACWQQYHLANMQRRDALGERSHCKFCGESSGAHRAWCTR